MGEYWRSDAAERTPLGHLVHALKDQRRHEVIPELETRLFEWWPTLRLPRTVLLVPVTPSPDRPAPQTAELYRRLATRLGLESSDAIERRSPTPRLRDLEPEERPGEAVAGDYRVVAEVADRHVVLIDDVVVTETTLRHVGSVVRAAGAGHVTGIALARSRRG